MPKVALLISNGFEEIEAVTIIDVLRRADVEVVIAGLDGDTVLGGHGIRMHVDTTVEQINIDDFDAVALPGGAPNAKRLRDDERAQSLIKAAKAADKYLLAICAAPIALDRADVIEGRRATSYPGNELPTAEYATERVVEDGKLITSRGPGTSLEFALAIVRRLAGHVKATELRQQMLVKV